MEKDIINRRNKKIFRFKKALRINLGAFYIFKKNNPSLWRINLPVVTSSLFTNVHKPRMGVRGGSGGRGHLIYKCAVIKYKIFYKIVKLLHATTSWKIQKC